MTKREAIELLMNISAFDIDSQRGARKQEALGIAIEALKTKKPIFSQVAIETGVYWLERQLDMYKENIFLNEQTMIVYIPFVTAEFVEACGGTFKRMR